jgi:hypothetical protein
VFSPTSRWPRLLLGLTMSLLFTACDPQTVPSDPARAQLLVFGSFDPDFTDRTNPTSARVVWMSTRSGTGRFLADDHELTEDRVPVSGGELVTTDIPPRNLEPGFNDVEIYFVLAQQGSTVLTESVLIEVTAECTRHDHCPGSCEAFECR